MSATEAGSAPNARDGRGRDESGGAQNVRATVRRRRNRSSPVSTTAGLMQNDDGRGSVHGVRDRWRAERSPSANSELPKVGSMTTPIAESGRVDEETMVGAVDGVDRQICTRPLQRARTSRRFRTGRDVISDAYSGRPRHRV